jgi:glutamine synthetase
MKVLAPEECAARQSIMLEQYIGTVEIEALCMVDMIVQHIIPSIKAAGVGPLPELEARVVMLTTALAGIHKTDDTVKKAQLSRELRLETMIRLREVCDAAEAVCPPKLWTIATYQELLFLDSYA